MGNTSSEIRYIQATIFRDNPRDFIHIERANITERLNIIDVLANDLAKNDPNRKPRTTNHHSAGIIPKLKGEIQSSTDSDATHPIPIPSPLTSIHIFAKLFTLSVSSKLVTFLLSAGSFRFRGKAGFLNGSAPDAFAHAWHRKPGPGLAAIVYRVWDGFFWGGWEWSELVTGRAGIWSAGGKEIKQEDTYGGKFLLALCTDLEAPCRRQNAPPFRARKPPFRRRCILVLRIPILVILIVAPSLLPLSLLSLSFCFCFRLCLCLLQRHFSQLAFFPRRLFILTFAFTFTPIRII